MWSYRRAIGKVSENMRKADKENFYRCVDEIKYLIDDNKVLSRKDIDTIINEMLMIKYALREKYKYES